jgi:hypothetical protein
VGAHQIPVRYHESFVNKNNLLTPWEQGNLGSKWATGGSIQLRKVQTSGTPCSKGITLLAKHFMICHNVSGENLIHQYLLRRHFEMQNACITSLKLFTVIPVRYLLGVTVKRRYVKKH